MENTVQITASDVNKLRQQTGAGMMDCKKALTEANGDFEKAVEILRKKGQKVAANRSDRSANEGYALALTSPDNKTAVLVSVNCETDFVAKNQGFVDFATSIANVAINKVPADADALAQEQIDGRSIADLITDMTGKIGEKIELGYYGTVNGEFVYAYNHPGNRVATIVALNKSGVADIQTLAKDVAMQAAAMAPVAVDKDDVSTVIIEQELDIAREILRKEGKPEDKIEMIAKGKLEKFFKESTLLNQDFIKDNKLSVGAYLKNADKDLTVSAFKRYQIGA